MKKQKCLNLRTQNALFRYFWARTLKKHCQMWNLKFVYFQNFMKKQKCLNLEPKMPDLCTFGLEFENKHPWICLIAKFRDKTKMPKFGTENALFGYFWTGILENYCHIWNQHLRICVNAKFCEETKMLRFGTKCGLFEYFWPTVLYLDIFGLEFKKNYCDISSQHLWICLIAKDCEIIKMPTFGTKSALFGYFWPKTLYLDIFGLEFFKKLLSYLKSAPSNLRYCKILWRNKNA